MQPIIPLIISYILNIVDYVFTAYWVHHFGVSIEANPFGRWLFKHNIAWVFKIFIIGAILLGLYKLIMITPKCTWILWLIASIYILIVFVMS